MKMGARKKRLMRRIQDHGLFMSRQSESKVQARKMAGGYKAPGSYTR